VLRGKVRKHFEQPSTLHTLLYLNVNVSALPWATMSTLAETEEARTFASLWVVTGEMFSCVYGGATWQQPIVGWMRID
jgi:hypothetical protein